MSINDVRIVFQELYQTTKPVIFFENSDDRALLGRVLDMSNNTNMTLDGTASSSICINLDRLERIYNQTPKDSDEQRLVDYLAQL
jgi:hypothetical protein